MPINIVYHCYILSTIANMNISSPILVCFVFLVDVHIHEIGTNAHNSSDEDVKIVNGTDGIVEFKEKNDYSKKSLVISIIYLYYI